ncbi:MAG: arginase family protein [Planctomycetia bacterium]|nr:arginase family protein [Planctomycetia bacterium]
MSRPSKTSAIFFPFDLFGSGGAAEGAKLLADAVREMLEDNRQEKKPTRAAAYQRHVRTTELTFEKLPDYEDWRQRGRDVARQAFDKGDFLLWTAGNHLGVLPVYDELAKLPGKTLVVQFDAHLDIYNLSDCTAELSHGNFLLHCDSPLPALVNLGHRELLLTPGYIDRYYQWTIPASELAIDPAPALERLRQACAIADRIFLDLDCDCFDPAFFPALAHPLPFGISPQQLLRLLAAAWSPKVCGAAISEFDPGRDANDRSLATLLWLVEWLLLTRYE